ncbi:unnamed protein product [Ectocarpus sp. 12 AP-2014]
MWYLAEFVDQDQCLYIAPVSKTFRRAWGPRATTTRPVVADTSVRQLTYCFGLGLPSSIRQATTCNAAARFGRLDLLKLAQESACGWTPATCAKAARGYTLRPSNGFAQRAVAGMKRLVNWPPSEVIPGS